MSEETETDLRSKILDLELKLHSGESEFNKQRSKFKSILLTQESELKLSQDKIEAVNSDNAAYQQQLDILRQEHSESQELLRLSETMDTQESERLKSNLEQEQASLRQSFHLQLQEYQAQLQLESVQRSKLLSERAALMQEVGKLRSLLDAVKKQKGPGSLEDEMTRAQEESSKLKNVVLPLETEIASLKRQLEEAKRDIPRTPVPRTQQADLIQFDADLPKVASPQDSFLSTILSTEDIVEQPCEGVSSSGKGDDVFDPLFDTSASVGLVQQILDISQGSSEVESRREEEERLRGLEGEVRDCQMRCAKYEGLLDELRADKEELMDKNGSLTHHLSTLTHDMHRHRAMAARMRDLVAVLSEEALTRCPDRFPSSDWEQVQQYIASDLSDTPGTPGESLLTLSPVKFSLWEGRGEDKGDKGDKKVEELEKKNRELEEEVRALQANSRSSGPTEASQTQKQMTFLTVTVDQQKQSLVKERKLRADLRKECSLHLSNFCSLEEAYLDKEAGVEKELAGMKEELKVAKSDAQQQVAALMDDREKLVGRIRHIEGGYSSLESQREGELKGYSVQLNEEKYRKSEAECNVAALSEQLASVQEAKQKQHSEFASKLSHKTDQVSKLQEEKRSQGEELSLLSKQTVELFQAKKQLEIVLKTKEELLKENQRLEAELIERDREKGSLGEQLSEERSVLEEKKAAFLRLKTELNTNEEVQRDFVRLSQQLQKQVAELEDERKLVLWENDEDIPQCRSCSQAFSKTRRRHRCKRCCVLFCSECSQWRSSNQQGKEIRVCEPCFKLIDKPTLVSSLSNKKRTSSVPQEQSKS